MIRKLIWLGFILIGAVVVVAIGVLAYVYFSGGSGDPSTEVTAPELEQAPDQVVFEIDKTQSTVRFELDELLRGDPFRVVGRTSEVAGQVQINFDNPSDSQVGTIVINVRTLATDSSLRDRATRGQILNSNQAENEFAQFVPTALEGLPDQIREGESWALTISGDLTLSGVTRSITFAVQVTLVDQNRLEVQGSATVLRSDFRLEIPDIPFVANVSDEVLLAVDLVALAV